MKVAAAFVPHSRPALLLQGDRELVKSESQAELGGQPAEKIHAAHAVGSPLARRISQLQAFRDAAEPPQLLRSSCQYSKP
jgi:hypothetical protein